MSKLTDEMRAIKLGDYREGTLIVMLNEAADLIDVLKKQIAHTSSWEGQVDRQSGSFTQDEINGFDGWGGN